MVHGAYGAGPVDRTRSWFQSTVRPVCDTAQRLIGITNGIDRGRDEVPQNGK
jgi:hypothetical protein